MLYINVDICLVFDINLLKFVGNRAVPTREKLRDFSSFPAAPNIITFYAVTTKLSARYPHSRDIVRVTARIYAGPWAIDSCKGYQ
jgi:hypothetical protein